MTVTLIKQMMDSCYLAKRARDLLPALPADVASSYIQYLEVVEALEAQGMKAKVSDISEALSLPRPGVTRTVKAMTEKGYLEKHTSAEDGRITYLTATEKGKQLSHRYNAEYFSRMLSYMEEIPEEDAACMIRTIQTLYRIMSERRHILDNE